MTAPDPRCPQHMDDPATYPCSHCMDAAYAFSDWSRAVEADRERQQRAYDEARRTDRMRNIAACPMCDDRGYTPTHTVCLHDPEQLETNRRGAALARQLLTGGTT